MLLHELGDDQVVGKRCPDYRAAGLVLSVVYSLNDVWWHALGEAASAKLEPCQQYGFFSPCLSLGEDARKGQHFFTLFALPRALGPPRIYERKDLRVDSTLWDLVCSIALPLYVEARNRPKASMSHAGSLRG